MIRRLLPIALLVLVGGSLAFAQQAPVPSSDLILSWRSNGFAPAGYAGRVAAAGGGTVLLTAEVLVGGRPADLSALEMRWYVNDELYETGLGLQSVSVPIGAFHQDTLDARVEVIAAPFSATLASLSVPLTDPAVVIEPRSGQTLRSGENLFVASPYSFNVTDADDLFYSWLVNGEEPQASENPRELRVSYDGLPTSALELGLSATHPENSDETTATSIRLLPPAAPAQ